MASDNQGNPLTDEQIAGLERFNQNDVSMKLCYRPSICITFEIDEVYTTEHEEDAAIYDAILPSQIRDVPFPPFSVGEILTFSKQYEGEIIGRKVIVKDFCVVTITKEITQDTARLCLYITVSVVPTSFEEKGEGV